MAEKYEQNRLKIDVSFRDTVFLRSQYLDIVGQLYVYNSKDCFGKQHECKFYDFQLIHSGHKTIHNKIVLSLCFSLPRLNRKIEKWQKKVNVPHIWYNNAN